MHIVNNLSRPQLASPWCVNCHHTFFDEQSLVGAKSTLYVENFFTPCCEAPNVKLVFLVPPKLADPILSYPSPEMEKWVKSLSPNGMPKLVNNQLYATDEIGYLKVKDKKARKEIKELRAEVEDLKKELHYLELTVNIIKKIQSS